MPIYVDNAAIKWRKKTWFHLMAVPKNDNELHEFAKKIGLKRAWFQEKSRAHYDVTAEKRQKAIEAGAILVSWRKLVELIKESEKVKK